MAVTSTAVTRLWVSGPLLPGFEAAHFPFALARPAVVALHPGRGTFVLEARQELVAGQPAILIARGGDGRHRSTRAGLRIFPGKARILAALGHDFGRGR